MVSPRVPPSVSWPKSGNCYQLYGRKPFSGELPPHRAGAQWTHHTHLPICCCSFPLNPSPTPRICHLIWNWSLLKKLDSFHTFQVINRLFQFGNSSLCKFCTSFSLKKLKYHHWMLLERLCPKMHLAWGWPNLLLSACQRESWFLLHIYLLFPSTVKTINTL